MNRLKFWRLERGLSQVELAEASDTPRHVIQLCEQFIRIPSFEYQMAIAESLGVSRGEVFFPRAEGDEGKVNLAPNGGLLELRGEEKNEKQSK